MCELVNCWELPQVARCLLGNIILTLKHKSMGSREIDGIIQWHSDFETGIARIDFEHKIFIELLNSFKYEINLKRSDEELFRIMNEIEKYAEFHFISEENAMRRMNYPAFKEHQIEHFELLEKFNLAKFKNCNFEGFHQFLKEWFLRHTVESDTKLKLYMLENNINLEDFFYELKI